MTKVASDWSPKTLRDVAKIQKGTTITSRTAQPGNVPVIAGGQQPAYFHNVANRPANTITVSASGAYAGFVAFHSKPIWASDCITVEPVDDQICLPEFLYYFMQARQNEIYSLQRGSGMPHVYAKDLALLEISVPTLEEQRRIVTALAEHLFKIDQVITELKGAQLKTRAFIKSYLLETVKGKSPAIVGRAAWQKRQVGALGKWRGGGTPSKSNPKFWVDGKIPWLTAKDMKTFKIEATQDHITELGVSGSSANLLPKNAVVIVIRSGILEWKLPVALTEVPVTINQDLKALVCAADVLPSWAAYSILGFEHRILEECRKAGTTVANLNFEDFLKFEIFLPPLEVQENLVSQIKSQLDYLDSIWAKVDYTTKTIKAMRTSLLKSAFSIELLRGR
jgi:restriction endonuclease S subunit